MNADDVIRSHREWKDRLRNAMATQDRLNVEVVSSEKECAFGKWAYSVVNSGF
jgi:hypothetical protein